MFTYPRRWIATASVALTFGLFSTAAIPVVSGQTGQADAAAKSKTATKHHTTRQS